MFYKKLPIRSNKASKIPIDLKLKISPSCDTLSKALDISKETPRNSRLYKYYGQWTLIDLHKNYWLENKIDEMIVLCFFYRCSIKYLKIILSNFFQQIGSKETCL